MSSTGEFLRVRNWERFQHYKGRNPPWIRLYNELLDNYDFGRLQDASKWHAVGIWLLASRFDNAVPADRGWIKQRINARSPVDLEALVSAGFIELYTDASGVLADCKQLATPEESRGEVEVEKKDLASLGPKKVRARGGVGTPLPADWEPDETAVRIAGEEHADIGREAVQFRDHAKATGRRLQDWNAGFRNWLRNEKKPHRGNGHRRTTREVAPDGRILRD